MSLKIKPKMNRLSWEDHHMLLALVTSRRSPDPNTQVGACIVDKENKILSLGYNGPPRGLGTHNIPWERVATSAELTKYLYVMHAEANAILNTDAELKGSSLIVTLFPCSECTKLIISSGVRTVTYLNDLYPDSPSILASKYMLNTLDIAVTKHKWTSVSTKQIESILSI